MPTRPDTPRRPRGGKPPSPATVRQIHGRLRERFGSLAPVRRMDPLEELVLTVLSQNTSDVNSDRAFTALRRRYRSWDELADADVDELADTIRAGGLANIKAARILAILEEIRERQGGRLDVSWMRGAPDDEVRAYLTTLPGVGPKTAACVLAFSLDRPALPVDTHVFRVGRRLGFVDQRTDAARAHDVMEALVPAELRVEMHVGLIRLGRTICRPGRPSCTSCPVFDLCPTGPVVVDGRAWAPVRGKAAGAPKPASKGGKAPPGESGRTGKREATDRRGKDRSAGF